MPAFSSITPARVSVSKVAELRVGDLQLEEWSPICQGTDNGLPADSRARWAIVRPALGFGSIFAMRCWPGVHSRWNRPTAAKRERFLLYSP